MWPIIEITKKDISFQWTEAAEKAFQEVKDRITLAPVLVYFDHSQTAYIEADSSDYM